MGPDGTKWARVSSDFARSPGVSGRAALRAGLRGAFLSASGTLARRPEGPFLHCIYLHGVYDDQVDNFRRLLKELLEIGRFVDTDEVFRVVEGSARPEDRLFHLSFDDGFDNNHRNAFPVLEELGIRAAFFVPSSLVGAPDAFALEQWWLPEVTPTRYMSWEQVGELHAAGHEIGSHTRTHANLRSIGGDAAALRDQIRGSRQEIEDRLGAPCRFIAWPFGRARDIGEEAMEEIVESGYAGCFSAIRGAASDDASPFRVPRHHFEADWPWPHVRYFALGKGGWLR